MDPEGLTTMLIPHDEVGPREKFAVNLQYPQQNQNQSFYIIRRDTSISEDNSDQTPPSQVICTAVPLPRPDTSIIFRHRADSTSETSSLSIDEEEAAAQQQTLIAADAATTTSTSFSTFQTYSALLGLLVGCFIQLSSLGANYLLSEVFLASNSELLVAAATENGKPTSTTVVRFSLFWSILTSLMGVTILILLRELVMTTHRAIATSTASSARIAGAIAMNLECYFAIGTLTGVCLSWTCTDVLLGFRAHFLHSLGTLVAALLWCKCITGCFAPEQEETQDALSSKVPLLVEAPSGNTHSSVKDKVLVLIHCTKFKLMSLLLGLITGFFIQFSSLGANFALSHFEMPSKEAPTANQLCFSLMWSIMTSGMGTGILTLARGMILFTFSFDHQSKRDGNGDDDDVVMEPSLLRLELFFAVGALLGVNLAWIGTDLVMGVQVQYIHALITEALGILAVALCARLAGGSTQQYHKHSCSSNIQQDLKGSYISLEP